MSRSVSLFVALALSLPTLAAAGPAGRGATQHKAIAAARHDEPLHVKVARAVFPREKWQRFISQASAELTDQIAQTGKGQIELAPGFADRLREQYEQLVPYEEMISYQARLLQSQYSTGELRRLLTFYRTPLGRKSVPFLNDLMSSAMHKAEVEVQNGLPGALAQLRPLVRRIPDGSTGAGSAAPDQGEHAEVAPPATEPQAGQDATDENAL